MHVSSLKIILKQLQLYVACHCGIWPVYALLCFENVCEFGEWLADKPAFCGKLSSGSLGCLSFI
jgi:hypothetical protein